MCVYVYRNVFQKVCVCVWKSFFLIFFGWRLELIGPREIKLIKFFFCSRGAW